MTKFTIHTADTAPAASVPSLERAQETFGMVPNLIGLLAESPSAVEAYQTLGGLFSKTSLSATERNLVWLTINYENSCHYCMAAHTGIALNDKVDKEVIEALRTGKELGDARLQSLREFTKAVVLERGDVSKQEVASFLAAGFTKENVLDILVGVSHKVLSNYANHIGDTQLDAPFEKFKWEKDAPAEPAASVG